MRPSTRKKMHCRCILDAVSWHIVGFRKRCMQPRRIQVPDIPKNLNQASFRHLKKYAVYLMVTLRRFSTSPLLNSDDRQLAEDQADYIQDALGAHPLRDDLIRTITDTENGTLFIRLRTLQERSQVEAVNGD